MACKYYVRSAASAVLATNRVLLAPENDDSGSLRLQVPPCKCIDFHAERRPRTPNGPATIEFALTSRNSIFRAGPAEPRATRLFEALFPQSRTHVSRVTAPTHHYLTQTRAPASATRLDTVAQASTGCSSTRPRSCRQAPPTSASTTRAARFDGPLAESSPRFCGDSRRRFPTTPYGGAAERPRVTERAARVYSNDRPFPRLCLYGVARHSRPPGPRRSAVPAPAAGRVAAAAPREGAGIFRLHGASMRPMPRALVEF